MKHYSLSSQYKHTSALRLRLFVNSVFVAFVEAIYRIIFGA